MKKDRPPLIERFFAGCIDGLVSLDIFLLLIYSVSQADNRDMFLNNILNSLILLFLLGMTLHLFQAYLTAKVGGSLGKIISGLQVVSRETEQLIEFKRAIFRRIVKLLLSAKVLWIGYLWIIIHHENLSWHDMAANTRVVSRSKNGWIVGLLISIVLIGAGVVLVQMAVQGFMENSHVYINLLLDIRNSF